MDYNFFMPTTTDSVRTESIALEGVPGDLLFKVANTATKPQIKEAVEKLFDVKLNGGWYTWSELSDKNMRAPDLAEKLYAHQDLLMSVRERMRIYGYGFDFEKKYGIEQAEADFDKTEAEEAVSESPK